MPRSSKDAAKRIHGFSVVAPFNLFSVTLEKHDYVDFSEEIWKFNLAFLQSFINYSKLFGQQHAHELSWNELETVHAEKKNWTLVLKSSTPL